MLNSDLQAEDKQVSIFSSNRTSEFEEERMKILNDLCSNFKKESNTAVVNHVVIGFTSRFDTVHSVTAYLFDADLDVVETKPLEEYITSNYDSNDIESINDTIKKSTLRLTIKANKVKLKNQNVQKTKK